MILIFDYQLSPSTGIASFEDLFGKQGMASRTKFLI